MSSVGSAIQDNSVYGKPEKISNKKTGSNTSKWLLSDETYKYLEKAYGWGNFAGAHPYVWDPELRRARLSSRRQQLKWKFNMGVAASHALFILYRVVYVWQCSACNLSKTKIYVTFMGFFWLLASILHFGVVINFRRYPVFTNLFLDFAQRTEKKYRKRDGKIPFVTNLAGLLLKMTYYIFGVLTSLLVAFALLNPGSPEQLTALHSSPKSLPLLIRLMNSFFIGYLEGLYHASGFLAIFSGVACNSIITIVLNELHASTAQASKDSLRQSTNALQIYKQLQMCIFWWNQVLGAFIFMGAKYMLVIFFVFCSYGAVRLDGIQALVLGVLGLFSFTYLNIVLALMAEVHSRSSRVREIWRRNRKRTARGHWLWRRALALRDINFVIGGMYHADHELVLTVCDVMLSQTVNFLVINP